MRVGIIGAVFIFAILYNGFVMHPQIDKSYLPTVVNGITASTSIVLGFAGVMLGLLYHEIFSKDEKTRSTLIALAFIFSIPIIYLYSVYSSLVSGDFDSATRIAFTGLIIASFAFIIIIIFASYRIEIADKKKKGQRSLDVFLS
jgi:FtsH-binding integral membrane protein